MTRRKGDTVYQVEKRQTQIRSLLVDGAPACEVVPFIQEHFKVSKRTVQNDIKVVRREMKAFQFDSLAEGVSKLIGQLENIRQAHRDNPDIMFKSMERQQRLFALALEQQLYTKSPESLDDVYGVWSSLVNIPGKDIKVSVR